MKLTHCLIWSAALVLLMLCFLCKVREKFLSLKLKSYLNLCKFVGWAVVTEIKNAGLWFLLFFPLRDLLYFTCLQAHLCMHELVIFSFLLWKPIKKEENMLFFLHGYKLIPLCLFCLFFIFSINPPVHHYFQQQLSFISYLWWLHSCWRLIIVELVLLPLLAYQKIWLMILIIDDILFSVVSFLRLFCIFSLIFNCLYLLLLPPLVYSPHLHHCWIFSLISKLLMCTWR